MVKSSSKLSKMLIYVKIKYTKKLKRDAMRNIACCTVLDSKSFGRIIKGIFQPFELGDENRLIRSDVKK